MPLVWSTVTVTILNFLVWFFGYCPPPKGWVTSALLATAATTVPSTWRQSRNAAI